MSGKLPYIQFYTGDWLKDPSLSICAPAARGVWMDLLCAMHEAGRSGELRGTTDQLARVARCSTAELVQALTELQTTGAADVNDRNGVVTVSNRRMRRDAELREKAANRQRRHRDQVPRDGPVTHSSRNGHGNVTSEGDSDNESENCISIPEILRTTEFMSEWEIWVARRKKRKWSIEPDCLNRQLAELAAVGHDAALKTIRETLKNGWQGIFPEKYINGSGKSKQGAGQIHESDRKKRAGQL
jgi:hypothetical protein